MTEDPEGRAPEYVLNPTRTIGQQSLVPVPDPTALTDAAIARAQNQFRRELDSIRTLLAERIATEISARDQAVSSLRDLVEQRFGDLDADLERRLADVHQLPDRVKADRNAEMASLREIIDTRLNSMDRATELLATDLRLVPSVLSERLSGLQALIGERIDAIDRATTLKLGETDKLPGAVKEQIDQLRMLHEERFSSIAQQFAERDVRTSQAQQASDQALNAALQAAKELVNAQGEASSAAAVKSETSFTKQIDQIGTIISTLEKALDARITELKERIDRGEGQSSGQTAAIGSPYEATVLRQTEKDAEAARQVAAGAQQRAVMALVISAILLIVTLSSVIFAITKKLFLHHCTFRHEATAWSVSLPRYRAAVRPAESDAPGYAPHGLLRTIPLGISDG